MVNKKAPSSFDEGLFLKLGQRLTLPGFTLVPSALVVLTALFGMGRGGPHRHSRLKFLQVIPIGCIDNPVNLPILKS